MYNKTSMSVITLWGRWCCVTWRKKSSPPKVPANILPHFCCPRGWIDTTLIWFSEAPWISAPWYIESSSVGWYCRVGAKWSQLEWFKHFNFFNSLKKTHQKSLKTKHPLISAGNHINHDQPLFLAIDFFPVKHEPTIASQRCGDYFRNRLLWNCGQLASWKSSFFHVWWLLVMQRLSWFTTPMGMMPLGWFTRGFPIFSLKISTFWSQQW